MRTLLILLLTGTVLLASGQTIHIVNNNPGAIGGVNNYTNLTDAMASVQDGDIMYIVPSGVNYGNLTINNQLTVYGIGLYPDTQTKLTSNVDRVVINTSNVRVSGLVITTTTANGVKVNQDVINTVIDKCSFKRFNADESGVANILIQNCIWGENYAYSADGHSRFSTATPNIRIANNIIYANQHSTSAYAVFYTLNGATIENNLFMNYQSGSRHRIFGSVTNSLIQNNIFYGASPNPRSTFTGNTIDYNVTFGSSNNNFTTTGNLYGTNNQIGVDPTFTNVQFSDSWDFNYDFTLLAGSPAEGTASDGSNVGIDGGLAPFDPTATSLPIIQSVVVPAMISQGSQLPVTIKGRGN